MSSPAPAAKRRGKNKPEPMPWQLVGLEDQDVMALQALAAGVANAGQQQRALHVITHKIARSHRMSFFPGADGHRATDFAEGKRFVGNQIDRILKMRPDHSAEGSTSEE